MPNSGRRVGEGGRRAVERVRRVRALGLQPPLDAVRRARSRAAARGRPRAAARGDAAPAPWSSSPTASSICGRRSRAAHRADQLAQRQQQVADVPRQDVAAADVGDVARLALVEADQHRALLHDVAHREPRPLPVAPGRPFDRPQHPLGPDLAEVPERVLERALLGRHLRGDVRGAASCSRRRRRSAGSAARPAARSACAARPATPAPSCSCAGAPRPAPPRRPAHPRRTRPCLRRCAPRLAPRDRATRSEATPRCSSWRRLSEPRCERLLNFAAPGESFVRAEPPKAQMDRRVASNAQVPRTGKRLRKQAFLAGERPVASGSTEGASSVVRGAANLSGRADSRGRSSRGREPRRRGCAICSGAAMTPPIRRQPRPPRCCTTPLHALHVELGAKMVPFAGYDDAGLVSAGHPRRAPPVPRVGGAVRRLAHGPAPPHRRRRRGGARDAGAGRHRRPGRRASSATRSSRTTPAASSTT